MILYGKHCPISRQGLIQQRRYDDNLAQETANRKYRKGNKEGKEAKELIIR